MFPLATVKAERETNKFSFILLSMTIKKIWHNGKKYGISE